MWSWEAWKGTQWGKLFRSWMHLCHKEGCPGREQRRLVKETGNKCWSSQTRNGYLQEQWALAMTIGLIPQLECFWSFSFQTCESRQVPERTRRQCILDKWKMSRHRGIILSMRWTEVKQKHNNIYYAGIFLDNFNFEIFGDGEIFQSTS